ncbi:uncharacterized protein LOC116941141 isoform X1 [Petromyzon marinus]|uniref:uncharacterized protein LOC116941141 isoform X1 n=1 Tax=Petromyzon marinus TaxID=7757 RepID=UPI003F722227
MALLQQIRLLSWKNGWTLLRTPFLPISVVVWPCILFIIIAILRTQSPPQQKSSCYLPVQTLPSGGFFPFLQSLLCDSTPECKNTSYLHSTTSRSRSLLYQDTGLDEAMVFQTMKMVRLHRQTVDAEMPRLQQDVDRILRQLEVNFTQVWDATKGTELGIHPTLWRNLSHTLFGRMLSSTGNNTDEMIFAQNMKILWCSQLTGMAENITTARSSQLSIYELNYFIANLLPTFNSTMQIWCNSDQSLLVEGLNTLNKTVTALNVTKIMDMLLNVNSSILTKIEDGILMLEGVQKQSEYLWQGVKEASSILMALTDAKAWSSLDSVTASLKDFKALANVSKELTSSYAELQPPMELIELILQAAISILEQPANPDNTAWRDWLDQGIQKGFNKSTNGDSFNISLSLFETVLTWLEKELQDNSSSSSSGTFWGLSSTDVSSVRVALRQARLWLPLLRQSARVYDWSSEGYAWALGVAEQALDGLQFGAEISKVLQAVQAVRDVILHATKLNTELLVLARQVVTVIAENIDLMASDANRRVDLLGQMIADVDVFVTEVKQKLQQNRSLSCMDLMVLWDMLPADILTDRQTVLSAMCQANTSGSTLGNLTAALGHYAALQGASTTLAILVNGSQVAPSGQPPRISELYASWQSVVDAAGENVDAQAKFYSYLQQVFGVMPPSPPSSTALLDSFLEHLLINLMLDVTDVVGMMVQQTLGWPSMDQLVNGLHWIISTINQQNTTSFTSKCEDIFSVPNVTLWANAPVPWRGLISEMIVFKNNAMTNDELIPRALHASMDLLNQMNIVNVDRNTLNTMFCSDKNLSSLIASFQQSNSTISATANLIQGILHDKSVTHVIALLYNNIRLWSQNSPPAEGQLYDDVSAILNRINVSKEFDILNHVIEVANTTGIDNAILPLVYGVLTEIQASGLLDNKTADILNTVQTFLKVNNSEQLLAEIKQLLSWVPQDSAQNSSRRVTEFLINVFENIIVPVLPAHDWAAILQPEISQQLMMNFINPKVVAKILSEIQLSHLVDRQVTENLNIAQTFLMMNSTQQILSHVVVLLHQAQPDEVRDLSIKIVRVLLKLYQKQIIPAFPENDWTGIFQPDTFQKLILQLMSPKVLADTLAEIESSDFLDAQTAEIIRIAQTFLNLNNSQQIFSQLNYVLSHGQPETYGNLTVSVLHVLYNIYQKHIIPQFPVDDWTALFVPGYFEKLISTLLSPGVFAEMLSEIENAGLLNPDVTGMLNTMQGLITANTTQDLFTHLRLLLDQWQPTYPNESNPVSFSIGMLKVLLSIAEMTDQPDTVDVKWMSVIEYSLKQITRSNFIPPDATDMIVTFIKVLTFVFEPNYFNLNNTNNTMQSLVNGLSSEISAYLQRFPDLREFMPFIMKASNTAAKLLDNATSEEAISTSLEAIISLVHNLRHIVTKSNPLMPTSASVCENNLTELGMFVAEQLSNLMPDKISEEFKNMTSLILHYTDALQAFIQNRDMPMDFFISFYKENYQLIKQLSDFLKNTDNDTLQALKSDASKVKLMVSEARMSNESLNTFLELSAQLLMEIGYILNTSEHFQSIPSFSSLLFLVDMVTAENSTTDTLFTNNSDINIRDIDIFLEIANSSTLLDVLQNIESLLHHLQDLQSSLHNDSLLLTLRSISGIMDQCGVFLEHLHIDPAAKEVFHILNSLSDIWIQDLSVVDYGSAHTQLNVFKAFIVYVVANMDTLIPIENEVRAVQFLLRSIEPLMESVSDANADGTPLYDKLNIVLHLITNMTDISTYTLEDFWRTFGSRGITEVDILEIQAIMMTIGMYVENIFNIIVEPAMNQSEIQAAAARLTELLLQMNHGSNASLPINRQTHEIMAIIMYPRSLQNISVIFQFLKIIVGDILPENGLLSLQQTEAILNFLHSAETMIAIQDVDKLVYWLQNSTFYFGDFLSQMETFNDTQTLSSLTSALSIMGHFLQLQSQLDTFVSYNISTPFTEELGSIFEFYGLNNLTDILMKAIEGIQLIHQLSSRDVFGMAEIQSIFSYSQSTLTFFTDPLVEEKSIHLGSKVVRLVGMFMIQQNYSVPNMVDTQCTVLAIIDQILSTNLKTVPTAMGLLNAAKCNVSEEELNADCSLPSRNVVYCAATLAAEIVTDFSEFISFPNQIVLPEDKFQELAYIFSCNLRQMQEWTVVLLKMAQVFDFSSSLLVDLNAKTMRLLDHIAETQLDICDDHSNPLAVSLILTLNSIDDLQCSHTFKSETLVAIMTDIVYFIKTANVPVNDKFLENAMADFQKVLDFLMQLGSIDIHETDLLLIANSTLEALNTLMENLSIHPKPNLSIFTYFINMLTMQENWRNTTAYPFPTDLNWYSNHSNMNNFTTEIQELIVFIYNSVRDDGNFSAKQLFADLGQLLVSSNASQPLKKLNFIRNINSFVHALEIVHPHIASAIKNFTVENHHMFLEEVAKTIGSFKEMNISFGNPLLFIASTFRSLEAIIRQLQHLTPEHSSVEVERLLQSITVFEEAIGQIFNSGNMTFQNGLMLDSLKHIFNMLDTMQIFNNSIEAEMLHNVISLCLDIKEFAMNMGSSNSSDVIVKEVMDMFLTTFPLDIGTVVLHFFKVIEKHNFEETYFNATEIVDGMIPLIEGLRNNSKAMADNIRHLNTMKILVQIIANMTTNDDWKNLMRIENNHTWLQKHEIMSKAFSSFMTELQNSGLLDSDTTVIFQAVQSLLKVETLDDFLTKNNISGIMDEQSSYIINIIRNLLNKNTTERLYWQLNHLHRGEFLESYNLTTNIARLMLNVFDHVVSPIIYVGELGNISIKDIFRNIFLNLLKADPLAGILNEIEISGFLDERSAKIVNMIVTSLKFNTSEDIYLQLKHLLRQGSTDPSQNLTFNILLTLFNIHNHVILPKLSPEEWANLSNPDIFQKLIVNLINANVVAQMLGEILSSGLIDQQSTNILDTVQNFLRLNTSEDIYLQLKHLLQQGSTDPSQNLTFNIFLTFFKIHEHVILPKLSPEEWANLSNPDIFQKLILNLMSANVVTDILREIRSSGFIDQQSANILGTVQIFLQLNTSEDLYQQLKHLLQQGSADPSQSLTFNIFLTLFNIHDHVILRKLSPEEWADLSNPDVFQKLILNVMNANVVADILREIRSSGLLDQQSANILGTVQIFLQLNTSDDIYLQLKHLLKQGPTDPSQNLTFNIFLTLFNMHDHVILPKLSPEEWANISNPDIFQKLLVNLMSANVVADILREIRSSGLLDQQSANVLDTVQTFLQLNTSDDIYQQLKHLLEQGPTDPSQNLTFNIFLTLLNIHDHVILTQLSPEEWANLSNPDIFQKLIVHLMSANVVADILREIRSSGLIDEQSANILGTVETFLQLNTSEDIYLQLKHLLQQGPIDPSQNLTFNILLTLFNIHDHVILRKLSPDEWANISNPDVFQKLILNLMNANVVADILREIRSSGLLDQQSANILGTVQIFLQLNTSEDVYQQLKHLLMQGSTDPSQNLTFNIFLTLFNIYDHVILSKLSPEEWANLSNPDVFQNLIVNLMNANVVTDILREIRSSGLLDQQSANILDTVQTFLRLNTSEDVYQELKHLLQQASTDPSQNLTFNIFLTLFNMHDHVILPKLSPEEWANISNPDIFQKLIVNLMSANVVADILREIRSSGLLDQQSANVLDTVQTFLQLNTSDDIYQQLKHLLEQGPTDPSQNLTFNIFLTLLNIHDHVILAQLSPEEWANLSNPDIFQKLIVHLMSANVVADILREIRSSGLLDQQSANILGTVETFLQLNTSEDIYLQLKHLLQQGPIDPSQNLTFNILLTLFNIHDHVMLRKLSPDEWANISNPDVFQKLILNLMNANVVADILREIRSSGLLDQQSANILGTVQIFLQLNTSEDVYQQLKHLLMQGSTDPSQNLTFNIFLTLFNIYDHVILSKLSPEEWANLSNPDVFQNLIVNLMNANVVTDILREIRSSGLLDQQSANILDTVQTFLRLNTSEDVYQELKHLLQQASTDPSQNLTFNIFLTLFNMHDHVILPKLSPEEWANISNPDIFQKLIVNLMSANVVADILREIRSSGLLDQQSANVLDTVQTFLQLNTSDDIYQQLKHLLEQGPTDPSQNLTFNIFLTLLNIHDHVILAQLSPEEWANLSNPDIFQKLIVHLMSANVVADILREIRSSGLLDQQSANILGTVQTFLQLNTSEDIYLQLKHLLQQGPIDPSQNLTFNILLTLFNIHDHVILPKLSLDEWANISNPDIFQKLIVNLMSANVVADILREIRSSGLLDQQSVNVLDTVQTFLQLNTSDDIYQQLKHLLEQGPTDPSQNLTFNIFLTLLNIHDHVILPKLSPDEWANISNSDVFQKLLVNLMNANVLADILSQMKVLGLLDESSMAILDAAFKSIDINSSKNVFIAFTNLVHMSLTNETQNLTLAIFDTFCNAFQHLIEQSLSMNSSNRFDAQIFYAGIFTPFTSNVITNVLAEIQASGLLNENITDLLKLVQTFLTVTSMQELQDDITALSNYVFGHDTKIAFSLLQLIRNHSSVSSTFSDEAFNEWVQIANATFYNLIQILQTLPATDDINVAKNVFNIMNHLIKNLSNVNITLLVNFIDKLYNELVNHDLQDIQSTIFKLIEGINLVQEITKANIYNASNMETIFSFLEAIRPLHVYDVQGMNVSTLTEQFLQLVRLHMLEISNSTLHAFGGHNCSTKAVIQHLLQQNVSNQVTPMEFMFDIGCKIADMTGNIENACSMHSNETTSCAAFIAVDILNIFQPLLYESQKNVTDSLPQLSDMFYCHLQWINEWTKILLKISETLNLPCPILLELDSGMTNLSESIIVHLNRSICLIEDDPILVSISNVLTLFANTTSMHNFNDAIKAIDTIMVAFSAMKDLGFPDNNTQTENIIAFIKNVFALLSDFNSTTNQDLFTGAKEIIRIIELLQRSFYFNVESQMASYLNFIQLLSITSERDWLNVTEHLLIGTLRALGNITNDQLITNVAELLIQTSTIITNLNGSSDEDYAKLITALKKLNTSSVQDRVELLNIVNIFRTVHQNLIDMSGNTNVSLPELLQIIANLLNSTDINFPEVNAYTLMVRKIISTMYNLSFSTGAESIMTKVGEIEQLVFEIIPFVSAESRLSLNNTLNILKSISGVLNIALSTSNSTTDGEVALIKAILSLLRVFGEERIYNGTFTADTAESILSVYFQVLHLVANDGFSVDDVVNSSVAVIELLQVLAGEVPALNVLAPLLESAKVAFLMAGGTTQQPAISSITKVCLYLSETFPSQFQPQLLWQIEKVLHGILLNFNDVQSSVCNFLACGNTQGMFHDLLQMAVSTSILVADSQQVVRDNASCTDVEFASRELDDIAVQTAADLQALALNTCRCQSHNSSSTAHLIMRLLSIATKNLSAAVVEQISSFITPLSLSDQATEEWIKTLIDVLTEEGNATTDEKLTLVVTRTGELFPRSALETQLLALQMVLRVAKDPVGELTVYGEAALFLLVGDATERIHLLNRTVALIYQAYNNTFGIFTAMGISPNEADALNEVLVVDLLKDPGILVEQLRQLTGLSEGTIAAFLGAKFTTSQVYDLAPLIIQSVNQMCNEETLTLLLKFPGGTSGNVSRDFCSLSPLASVKMVIALLEHINIRNVIYKMLTPQILKDFENLLLIVVDRLLMIMQKVEPFMTTLPQLLDAVRQLNISDMMQSSQSPGTRQARSTNSQSLSKLSKNFCAGTTQRMLADVRMVNLPTPSPSSSSLSPEDFKAKYNIPNGTSPYCLDVYTDIIHSNNGEVIWRFLKPLMLGKILYTPRSAATELLIRTANSTFQKMGELSSYAQEWLDAMGNQNSNLQIQQLGILKNALANPFVQGLIRSQLNINMTSFMQNLKSFEELGVQLTDTTMDNLKMLSTLMVNISSCVELNRFMPSDSVEELNTRAIGLNKENNLMASIIFHLPEAQDRSRRAVSNLPLATHLNYTLRLSIQNVMRTDYLRDLVWVPGPHTNQNYMYYTHAFLPIQDMLERAAISLYIGRNISEPALQVQPMPYPCYTDDSFLHSVGLMFPILFMIAWILTIASTVKFLVQEKELCQQEYMNIMGVRPASHFLSWLLQSCVLLLLMVILLTVILKASGTLPSINWALLLALFLCFGISVLAMGYMLSACFTHTNVASLTACFIYLLSFFPFLALSSLTLKLTRWQKSLICLLSPTAFSYASQLMGHFEDQGIGVQWSNMYHSPLFGDDVSFAYLCWMLIIDTAIYFILGWYIRNVYPGTYGLARPFYFIFTVSYWQEVCCCGSRRRPMGYLVRNMAQESSADSKTDAKDGSMRPQLEAVPADLTAGVSLRSLTKQYSKGKKAALQDLSLDFYQDQITTLLGHNGAGKTTTMSLLMGLYEPSSGSVHVGGHDARTDMAEVRRQLGVCLQRDVLFPALNVHEHLLLYGRLKALDWSRQRLQQEVDTFLNDLGLYNHKDKLVGTLSGGMKRKLSIAIAFIGGSTTVILDEPTSGVDPCSRRSIWNLILKHRAGRTIILSTHHLDEAEVLSDRIAVLEHGKLRCCGSPQYLKEIYGQGLTLTLTKKSVTLGSRPPFDPERVVSLVRSGVAGAVLKSGEDSSGNRNADMVFLLPAHSQNVLGQSFLVTLEENMEELGLSGYAISDTTLEEVFLKLVQEAEDQRLKDITNKSPEAESGSINSETAAPPDHTSPAASDTSDTVSLESEGSSQDSYEKHLVKKERVTGIHLLVRKTQALIYKRFHHWRRDVKGAAAQIVLPVILVALAMAFASMEPGVPEYPSLHLQPSLYSSASFFSLHNSSSASASSLASTLMKRAACLDQPPSRNNSCWTNSPPTPWFPSVRGDESSCSCTSCKELCSAVQDMPSYMNVNPQLQIFNLSGEDVEEYLMGTTCQYLLKRYGGWSFGLPHSTTSDLEVVPDNRTLTKVWYNPEGYHALPAYVNSFNNLLLWDNLPDGEHPGDYRISVNSKPYAGQQLSQDMILQNLGDTGVAICILLGFSILTGSFATAVVRERITGSKRLQQISGVSPTFYWAVNFTYDMVSYTVTTGLCIAVIAAFHLPAYTDNSNLGAVSLLLILFGFASLPWMYLISGVFSEEEMAFVTYISINIILGVSTIISTFLVNFLYLSSDSQSLYNAYNIMRWLFLVFPQFCLGWGLVSLSKQRLMEDIMKLLGSDPQESSSFAMDITGWPFVALAVNGIVCFTLRLVLTDELIWKLRWWRRKAVEPGQPELDTDVQAERSRVEEQSRVVDAATPDDTLQLVGLRKRYRLLNRSFTAVDGLHLGVSPNQCFGLLGVNGAGKTTTFKMLTGDIQPSGGDAIIRTQNGALLKMEKARRTGTLIGYCPQFDALDDLLTGWEHLYCYARIRGIPSHHIEQVSQELVTRLHLSLHADKLVKTYSGGTKRKLSTALALIGKPQLLLLDEPSSGMDPKSKRYLWKTITREVRGGCSVILTSHSMEECEALCDKLAIMVNGQFKCLGTLQHLKNRFGNGHMIKLRLSSGNSKVTEVTEFITSHFPGAYLKEQHISQLEFQVPSNAGKLSEIFIALEKEKESLSIQHYSISQTTLDQVFINFARQQIDMEEESSNADARPPVPTV